MSDELFPSEPASAEVCGLPSRPQSQGRDRLEEIASDFLTRIRAGERVDIERIATQHPTLTEELRSFLPLVAAMEDWKSQQELRCIQHPLPERMEISHLGDCRILGEIARGGMGVVFEAEQGSLGRRVAIKLLPWRFPKNSTWAEQFLREARIAAGLQHPNIVPVFSFGEQDDRYFYVMQLIEGVGLDKLIDRWKSDAGLVSIEDLIGDIRPSLLKPEGDQSKSSKHLLRHDSWQQLGKIAAQVVSAIRYAHKKRTLHRDIKPANLLIDRQGKVWIADFGLAIGRERLMSDSADPLAGTLRYMAPEQFRGEGDERSDLYSFGATLYELCTLQPAFPSRSRGELLSDIQRGEVVRPRTVNPAIPPRLEQIILKAMACEPQRRYQTADQLHADLLSFINTCGSRDERSWWRKIKSWF